jgi:hypothetical protein
VTYGEKHRDIWRAAMIQEIRVGIVDTRAPADASAEMVVPHNLGLAGKTTALQATTQSLAVSVLDLVATRAGESAGSGQRWSHAAKSCTAGVRDDVGGNRRNCQDLSDSPILLLDATSRIAFVLYHLLGYRIGDAAAKARLMEKQYRAPLRRAYVQLASFRLQDDPPASQGAERSSPACLGQNYELVEMDSCLLI